MNTTTMSETRSRRQYRTVCRSRSWLRCFVKIWIKLIATYECALPWSMHRSFCYISLILLYNYHYGTVQYSTTITNKHSKCQRKAIFSCYRYRNIQHQKLRYPNTIAFYKKKVIITMLFIFYFVFLVICCSLTNK